MTGPVLPSLKSCLNGVINSTHIHNQMQDYFFNTPNIVIYVLLQYKLFNDTFTASITLARESLNIA